MSRGLRTRPARPAPAAVDNEHRITFRLLPKLDVVGSSPIARSFEVLTVPTGYNRPDPNGSQRFFRGTRWGIDFRRQEGLLRRPRQRLTTPKAYMARKRHAATACLFAW